MRRVLDPADKVLLISQLAGFEHLDALVEVVGACQVDQVFLLLILPRLQPRYLKKAFCLVPDEIWVSHSESVISG